METELDAQVQVVAQAVASNADLCHDALDAMDMGDVESGVDSDFEFDMGNDSLSQKLHQLNVCISSLLSWSYGFLF